MIPSFDAWRESAIQWSRWAHAILSELGLQPLGGSWGDASARDHIRDIVMRSKGSESVSPINFVRQLINIQKLASHFGFEFSYRLSIPDRLPEGFDAILAYRFPDVISTFSKSHTVELGEIGSTIRADIYEEIDPPDDPLPF